MVIAAWIVVRLIRNRILGRRTTVTDAIVQETHTAYEFEDRTIATWGATYPVAYEYDPWGRLVAMATTREPTCANQNLWYLLGEGMLLSDTSYPDYPPELDTTLWSYDLPTGLLISKTYADGQGPSYTYTFDGKLATRTWARGVTTEYSYASCCNSLTNIAYSDDTPDVAYAYDRLGRITSAIAAGVATNLFEYDGLDLAGETQNGIAITRATDSLGRPAGFTLGSDYEVGYGYDAYGRFHSVSSSVASATSLANYAYLPGSDLLSGMTNSSGFFWTRTYEQQRNLIASVENRFNANLISRFDYANDSLARRTRRVDNLNVTNDFGYNLRSEVIGAAMGTNRYRYAYDPIGNRLTATNNAEGWSYLSNPLNQYTNIADGTMVMPEYDLDGNTTATGDGWRYVWNGENRMILASNSQYIVTYAYDHQGRMVSKTVNGSVRQFFWDGYNIVRSLTHSQTHTLTNSFIWGLDLSGSLQGAGGVGGLLAEVKDGVPYFAAFDANGNVTEYISTNRITEAHYEYSPFGEIVVQSGDLADSFTHRFSTKPWCGVTGLSEYLFRKYEPGLGRWMSRDPIGEHGGRHLYAISRRFRVCGGKLEWLGRDRDGPACRDWGIVRT
jgi:RHS repeat-associated protein